MDHKEIAAVFISRTYHKPFLLLKSYGKTPHYVVWCKEFAISQGFKAEELLSDYAKKHEEWKKLQTTNL